MDLSKIVSLENASQRLGVIPELGGSTAFWEVKREDGWQAIYRPWDPSVTERRIIGNFALLPFSNRITGGGFTFDGQFYPMELNRQDPFPIHGNGWMHTWEVAEHSARRIVLAIESNKKHGYPWHYKGLQTYTLDGDTMTMRIDVTHLGDKPLPYGLAWHPFQLRGADEGGPRLQFKADGYWQATADSVPTDYVKGLPKGWDFNTLTRLGHGKIDNNFSGWDGHMIMERDDINLRLVWETTEPAGLELSILFRPENQAFFCFEPITHITDAINREGMPGMRVLKQGESMALEVKQTLSRLRA